MPQQLQQPRTQREFSDESIAEVKQIIRDFLTRLRYRDPHTPRNQKLRAEISAEINFWDVQLSPKQIEEIADTACTIAESAYAHITYEHQRVVAKFSAHVVYVDNLDIRDLEVVAQFGHRLLAAADFGNRSIERLTALLRGMYALYPRRACDSFIVSTLDFLISVHDELTSGGQVVIPGATLHPWYMRQKSGIGPAYALFNYFVKDWRDPADRFHLQLVPDLEICTDMIKYVSFLWT
ncbi:hypothetical protein C2E23DRAFT_871523 [Lenzites betulinus]|nr:hypothetical protein C2E23DRAFT_871523 [Lenzites betulinus]